MSRIGYTFEIVFFCLAAVFKHGNTVKKTYRKKNRTVSFIIFLSAEKFGGAKFAGLFWLEGTFKISPTKRIHPFGKPSLISRAILNIGAGRGDFFYHGTLKIGRIPKLYTLRHLFFVKTKVCHLYKILFIIFFSEIKTELCHFWL